MEAGNVRAAKLDRKARLSKRTEASESGAVADGEDESERNFQDMMDIVKFLWSQPPMSGTRPSPLDVSREKVEAWLAK